MEVSHTMIKTKFALLLPIFLSIVTIFSYFTPESLARSEDYIYSSVYEQVTPSIVQTLPKPAAKCKEYNVLIYSPQL